MAKRKDSTALFEAISKSKEKHSKEGFVVPSWMRNRAQQSSTAAPERSPSPAQVSLQASSGEPRANWKQLASQHRLGLLAAAAVVVILAVFLAGRTSRDQANDAQPLPDMTANNVPGAPETPSKRIPGKYYLVIQVVPESKASDAAKIADWLTKVKGEPAEVRTMPYKGQTLSVVWSLRGLDNKEQVDDYARKIETMGKEYVKIGNYVLTQRNKGKLNPLYEKEPEHK